MYEADELTDATEEIVLKRSRRNLALTEERNSLQEDRRQYRVELSDRIQLESRKEDLERRGFHVIVLPSGHDRNAHLARWLQALLDTVSGPVTKRDNP